MRIVAIISWCVLGLQIGGLIMQIIFTRRAHKNWRLSQFWVDKTKRLNILAESLYASLVGEKENDDD